MDPATYNTYYFTNGFYVYNDFYEFYVATRDDAAKIDAGTLSLDNVSWIKTNGQGDGISYTFPAPVTYQQLADPAYGGTPLRLYVRLKNSTNANASCQPVYIPLELPKTDFMVGSAYAISADWVCDYYKTAVVAASFKGYCNSKFELFEADASGNPIGSVIETKEYSAGGTTVSYTPSVPLYPDKTYKVHVTIYRLDGSIGYEKDVFLKPPAKSFLEQRSFSITADYKMACDLSSDSARINLGGMVPGLNIKLESAPAGYDAAQTMPNGNRVMKVGETITLPSDFKNPLFFPTDFNYTTYTWSYPTGWANLPEGQYKYVLTHNCDPGKSVTLSINISHRKRVFQKSLITDATVAKETVCGGVNIYPFRNNIVDYLVDDTGKPYPVAMTFKINNTIVGTFNFDPAKINDPATQNFFIKAPKADAAMTVVYDASTQYMFSTSGSDNKYVLCNITTSTFTVTYKKLTYDKDTYYGYRCQGGTTAYMGIQAINGLGDSYTYVLRDLKTGQALQTQSNVKAGTMAYFNFGGTDIAAQYRMTIKDDACPGEEVYEILQLADLTASVIRPYLRKVCTTNSASQVISPINGIDGVLAENMMSYVWSVKTPNDNIIGLAGSDTPQNQVMSGTLSLKDGINIPQTAVYQVTPTYGSCPGQPFDITLYVSPCINYWQGGTDNLWNKPENWTENYVPKPLENVEFATAENNPPYPGIPGSGPAERDLYVPAGDPKVVGKLINETELATVVPAATSLTVAKEIVGSSQPEQADKLIVGAEKDKANGTLIVATGCVQAPIYGTVQLYAKGFKGTLSTWTDNIEGSPTKGKEFTSEYHWQYFGVPVESIVANPTFYGSKLRQYDETYNGDQSQFYEKWHWLNNESMLDAFKGYSITQENPTTYSIAGKLQFCDNNIIMTRQAKAVTNASGLPQNVHYGLGQNLFGNSYTAAIDISKLNLPANVEQTVYMYNTGRFHDWAATGAREEAAPAQMSAGNWFAIPKESAEAVWNNEIPSMQGFMLKFTDEELAKGVGAEQMINIPYATAAGEINVRPNTKPQLAPGTAGSHPAEKRKVADYAPLSYLRVNLESASTRDALWLISREGTTGSFDNGWDGRKYFGTPTAYIFTENKDGLMQVNADNSLDGSIISFYANADTDYELTLIKSNLRQYNDLHLLDMNARTATALDGDTTTYRFSSTNQGNVEKRFMIVNTRDINFDRMKFGILDARVKNDKLLIVNNLTGIDGQVSLFDASGRTLLTREMPAGVLEIPLNISKGVYVVNLSVEGRREPIKIVIR